MNAAAPALSADEIRELLEIARRTALGAGDLVRAGRREGVTVAATKTSPVDVVTALDTEAERYIRDALSRLRPRDGILGEEEGFHLGDSGLTWVVDPIDGTVNFLYGIPAYAISIAVVSGDPTEPGAWTAEASCVHAPAMARTYVAGRGLGAWRTERAEEEVRLSVNRPVRLADALVGTGFGYRAERRSAQGRVLATLLPRIRDIRRAGAASLDLCAVAAGELDGFYERGLNPWDLAGGALIVTEAGGVVRGLEGRPAAESMTLAGPLAVVDALDEFLTAMHAESDDTAAE